MNRKKRRLIKRKLKKEYGKTNEETFTAWNNLLKECNGDVGLAEKAVADLLAERVEEFNKKEG
jgi:hypothetical protein